MPITRNVRKLTVGLLAVPESSAAVIYGLHEVFSCVGNIWEKLTGDQVRSREMTPRIVGPTTDLVRTVLGVPLQPDLAFDDMSRMDVVVVPDLFVEANASTKDMWTDATWWLRSQREHGAIICSVCTGSLLLAEAGLLSGREATTHWSAAPILKSGYPNIDLRPERVLVPSGTNHDIVTSGGSASWTDLSLYLIARFCGEDEARRIAKIFLFGDRSNGQLPFAAMARPSQHDDAAISDCQSWIANNYQVPNPVAEMTERSKLTPRTFKRRFRAATGYTPIDYVQSLRIEEAKHMLETGDGGIEGISEQVGYEDGGACRRLFKRQVGVSPSEYRRRFRHVAS